MKSESINRVKQFRAFWMNERRGSLQEYYYNDDGSKFIYGNSAEKILLDIYKDYGTPNLANSIVRTFIGEVCILEISQPYATAYHIVAPVGFQIIPTNIISLIKTQGSLIYLGPEVSL
jgi:hypothetical protein